MWRRRGVLFFLSLSVTARTTGLAALGLSPATLYVFSGSLMARGSRCSCSGRRSSTSQAVLHPASSSLRYAKPSRRRCPAAPGGAEPWPSAGCRELADVMPPVEFSM